MRPTSFAIIVFLSATLLCAPFALAQSTSPEALYDRGMDAITGVGSVQNEAEGVDYFRRSAEVGYGPAQIALGYYYETGAVIAKDQAQALTLYRKAALAGDPLAAWLAGRLYYLGNGTARDLDAAQKWLKMSAGQNNAYGAYFLGRLMADRDATKAPALYKIAAEQGLPQAQYYYGKALKEGIGIAKDPFNAYIWLSIASDAGYNAASRDLLDISTGGSLTVDQISSAKAKARDMEQMVIRAVTARGCSGWDGEFDEMPTAPPPKLQRFCH